MPRRFRIAIPLAVPLMIVAIISIAGFQVYWMRMLYKQEWAELKKETDIDFRDVVFKLQMQRIQKDSFFIKHGLPPNLVLLNMVDSARTQVVDPDDLAPPSFPRRNLTVSVQEFDVRDSGGQRIRTPIVSTGLGPSLTAARIDSAYRLELAKSHITVPFRIDRLQGPIRLPDRPKLADTLKTSFMDVGGSNKEYVYQATFGSPVRYILGRMVWPITAGFLLVGFTALAFVVLHRNLQQQQRLTQYKNDFISNMTHELKTPISTIKVAVEALRHFDALNDPKRTHEYLDISALELHRLSMLVDKVLKLSLLEKNAIEFHLTGFELRDLAAEVMAEMRLPFEKAGAVVQLTGDGASKVRGDRVHLSSVISNLLDNALKYSKETPVITVRVWREDGMVLLAVTDNGIGIPAAYQHRIFDKFFRVPSDDHHNIKGYGLGLNYIHDIVQIHKGSIGVESKEGKGSTFTIKLPADEQN